MPYVKPWTERRLRRWASLWAPLLIVTALSIIISQWLWHRTLRTETPQQKYLRAWHAGELETAESLAWKILVRRPSDIESWVRFIDAHDRVVESIDEERGETPEVSDGEVRALLAKVDVRPVQTLATYWYDETSDRKPDARPVAALADARPPARMANYILARAAMDAEEWATAAGRFEREGLAFSKDSARNLRGALALWVRHDDWAAVRKRATDRRYAEVFDARFRLELAIHDRDWPRVLLWAWPASFSDWHAWPVGLAVLAAVLWFVIATRLGRLQDAVPGRRTLYLASFALGVVSVVPTIILIIVEEELFGLRELGQFFPDAIYFIFGVGLREELCKLLLFLPLLPALLRRGSRIEAMTCGALVGLGFAAEENIGYFHEFGAAAAISRFLTANFLHMSLTAIIALSVFDTRRGRATSNDTFSAVFPMAVAIHGAYDFFLSTDEMPMSSFIAMALFIVISRQFLRQLTIASSREEERGVLNLLIASLSLLTGASYVYATTLAGPAEALRLVAVGMVGVAIVLYMFVRELA
jgi:RsiW-degrading membrane proteinase PrsW (M82 family)